ncbi:MAG: hypothetical protein RLY31_1162 [Bacteroidota bacterium]|jgi:membrane protease YdiL (CAAX protease family)
MDTLVSVALVTLCFSAYHFLTKTETWEKLVSVPRFGLSRAAYSIYVYRLFGAFLYGLVPLAVCVAIGTPLDSVGLSMAYHPSAPGWFLGLGSLAFAVNIFAARTEGNLAMYPQIRINPPWGAALLSGSAMTWALYLFAYEVLFRGILLFGCLQDMDKWPAIAVNASLYAFAHVHKGRRETLGAIPLGILLCLMTLQTGNILVAVLVHSLLAFSNEWWSLWWAARRKSPVRDKQE